MLRACLAIVLLSCAASPVLAQSGRAESPSASNTGGAGRAADAGTTAPGQDKASASGYTRGAATPGTQGGGDDDSLLRVRVPKWNSFLPGMFR